VTIGEKAVILGGTNWQKAQVDTACLHTLYKVAHDLQNDAFISQIIFDIFLTKLPTDSIVSLYNK
jgi:hypothetical protein